MKKILDKNQGAENIMTNKMISNIENKKNKIYQKLDTDTTAFYIDLLKRYDNLLYRIYSKLEAEINLCKNTPSFDEAKLKK